MATSQQTIVLSSSLPFLSDNGLHGQVIELGVDSLMLQFEQALQESTILAQAQQITVSFGEQERFIFIGSLMQQNQQWCLTLNSESIVHLRALSARVRKSQHIEICANQDVEASDKFSGFNRVSFIPDALPELSLAQIDTRSTLLNRVFSYPIMIAGMTGGIEKGAMINQRLAKVAEAFDIPMGIGSIRMALEDPSLKSVFDVKKQAPNLFLVSNLGFAQLRQKDYLTAAKQAVEMVEADALAIHLNALQELIQIEGDRDFSGVLERLAQVCEKLSVPVIVKEVGCGISVDTAKKLIEAGVSGIDVGGRGGTSWGYIEGLRSNAEQTMALAAQFRDWGIPTAYSLAAVRKLDNTLPLIATGGIRDGLTVAKAVALGANMAGIGLPLLTASLKGEEALFDCVETLVRGLQITMVATGCNTLSQLNSRICLGQPLQDSFEAVVGTDSMV